MADLKKHVGVVTNTGARVAVVFREIPNDTTNCLVVETDRLPDGYHDDLINIINSKEAQETVNLYEVLNRRTFHDGLTCLPALHQKGFLRKVDVKLINMLPLPNKSVPLGLINAQINGTVEQYKAQQSAPVQKDPETPLEQAKAMIAEARRLEDKAEELKEQAYALVPELRPQGRGRPKNDPEAKAVAANKRKETRKSKNEQSKLAVQDEALDNAVNQKIARDALRQEV